VKIGTHWRINLDELQNWLVEQGDTSINGAHVRAGMGSIQNGGREAMAR